MHIYIHVISYILKYKCVYIYIYVYPHTHRTTTRLAQAPGGGPGPLPKLPGLEAELGSLGRRKEEPRHGQGLAAASHLEAHEA